MKIYRNMKVQQLVHVAYERTPTLVGVRMILDMRPLIRTLIFPLLFFQIFKNFFILIILFCLKTQCYIFGLYLFAIGRDRFFTVDICFKKILFFKYFSIPQTSYAYVHSFEYFHHFHDFIIKLYKTRTCTQLQVVL